MDTRLTDHDYLLEQVRKGFNEETASDTRPMEDLLSDISRSKQEHRLKKKSLVSTQREKRMRQLRLERLLRDTSILILQHELLFIALFCFNKLYNPLSKMPQTFLLDHMTCCFKNS